MTDLADNFDNVLEADLDLTTDRTPLSRNPLFAFLDEQDDLLTPEEECVLARAARGGSERARKELVERNLALVLSLVEASGPPNEHDRLDRIQAGSIGLMRAVDRFDPSFGNRLSTYATWWIRQAINRERERNELHAGVPADLARKIRTHEHLWWTEHGGEPTDRQLADFAGLDLDEVTCARAGMRPYSLDVPVKQDGDTALGDFIADDGASDPADIVERLDLRAEITEHLRHLDDRSRNVIRLRFGIETGKPEPLSRIAARTGMPLDHTRALTARAIRTLQRRVSPPVPRRVGDLAWPDRCPQTARQGARLLSSRQPRCPHTAQMREATA